MCESGTLPGGGRCKSATFYAELTKCAGEPEFDADRQTLSAAGSVRRRPTWVSRANIGHGIRTNNVLERIMCEIRRRTRVVGNLPDGTAALILVAARLRHIAGTKWGDRVYLT
jgi:hypothetical protein